MSRCRPVLLHGIPEIFISLQEERSFISWVGNLTKEKSAVFSEVYSMAIFSYYRFSV
jgi:hypothetical protein